MSDSDDMDARVAALGATVHEEGAASAAPAHEYPLDMLSSSKEEEAPTQKGPPKKRKTTGRLTAQEDHATCVRGTRDTQPQHGNNLLENRVNHLEGAWEDLQRQLAV
jgi:hypothetical protein